MSAGYVYMVGAVNGSYVKIGYPADPAKRLANLQTANPFPLELLATVPGTVELEGVLHLWFADLRLSGEWFRFPIRDAVDQFRAAIARIATLDGCPFEWTELYVDVKRYHQPHRPSLRDRLADCFRTEPVDATRTRLLLASGALTSARAFLRDERYRASHTT